MYEESENLLPVAFEFISIVGSTKTSVSTIFSKPSIPTVTDLYDAGLKFSRSICCPLLSI
jgi:hypothetical protein